jgi:LmbE family N-acetylglucosaminyl deacetylase
MRRRRRGIGVPAALALAVLGIRWPGITLWHPDQPQRRAPLRPPAAMPLPTARDRVLVLTPHSDDETLACGGAIAASLRAGAEVRVAFANSGDGFRHAVERFFGESAVTPEDYVRMAAERRQESRNALAHLGLAADRMTFLGYPDGSTAPMWLRCWAPDHLYTSPHTHKDHNPYPHSLRPGAPYCARSMIDDIKTVILRFKPTILFCPHPNDDHPDHWALYCCTMAALYEADLLGRVKVRLYVVHSGLKGEWPAPPGPHPSEPMMPPPDLAGYGAGWESLRLPPALARRKEEAIGEYRSQMLVMRSFLLSFARSSEVFEVGSLGRLPAVKTGTIKVDGNPGDWRGIAAAIEDPARDLAKPDITASADLARVYAAHDGQRLFLRLDLRQSAVADIEYALHVNVLWKGQVGPPQSYALRLGRKTPGCESAVSGRCLELSLPLPNSPQMEGIMLGADSRQGSHVLDKTAWVLLKTGPRLRHTQGRA